MHWYADTANSLFEFALLDAAPYSRLSQGQPDWERTRRGNSFMATKYASPSPAAFLEHRQWRFFGLPRGGQNGVGNTIFSVTASRHLKVMGRYFIGLAIIFLITLIGVRTGGANPSTAGFMFLIAILSASTSWGFGVSAAMSLAATLAFDYFFLPPIGSLNIDDPHDWIALSSFLVTAVIGSHLAARARNQAREADRRRQELERLYDLSQRLLHAENQTDLCKEIPGHIVDSFRVDAAALFLAGHQEVYRAGSDLAQFDDDGLKAAAEGADA